MNSSALLFVCAVAIPWAIWVGFDSGNDDSADGPSTAARVIVTLLLWVIVIPYRLVMQGRAREEEKAAAEIQMEAAAPAGWYADPLGVAPFRFWSGQAWTDHTAPPNR